MNKYYFTDGKKEFGPFSKDELRNSDISRKTKVWCYGMDDWTKLSDVPELSDVVNSIPPELKSISFNEALSQNIKPEPSQGRETTASQPKQKNRATPIKKWLIGVMVIIVISFVSYLVIQKRSNVNLHNEIVENSYDSGEDFDMYVQKFYRDLEFHGIFPKKPKVTIIKFSKLDHIDNTTHIHALSFGCNDDDRIEIYINPSTWEQFNKPMRYFLMYHELGHDILNLEDLDANPEYEGKLMYPEISTYENKDMDDFIESYHALFEEESTR